LRLGRDQYPVVAEVHDGFTIGRAKLLRSGRDVTIVTTGILVGEGLKAVEILRDRGHSARLIHLPTVKPLDTEPLILAARETRGTVTAEEHSILGGLGEAVAALLAEVCPAPVRRVGVRDVFGESGRAEELLDRYGLRAVNIVEEAMTILRRSAE